MTLLLGPPSSGKTTLLLALAGRLDDSLKVNGRVSYNGYELKEFVPRKTMSYVSQNDFHVSEMTVKETLDFSARCQGVGSRYELLAELARREKEAGIVPDAEVDLFMKILGLDICRDTMVGNEMQRGISGGQKKRVTTGEMLVGPTNAYFMDEISTGLDSSTTFQIVKCMQQIAHQMESTVFISLLPPAPATYNLFDDVVLLSEGQIVYQGPRDSVLDFFESCGFKCPKRKGTADFLQEVTSRKDQITVVALISSSVFLKAKEHTKTEDDGAVFIGALTFVVILNTFNGFANLAFMIQRLPVFYKHRDLLFHPAWAFSLPTFLLGLPISLFESLAWMVMTYYTVGYAHEGSRFFKQLLAVFLIQQTGSGFFRCIVGVCKTNTVSNTGGTLVLCLNFLLSGFVIQKDRIPALWGWGYWLSPLNYAYNALVINEMTAPRWMNLYASNNVTRLGDQVLKNFQAHTETKWFWISVAALLGFIVFYNIIFTIALTYFKAPGKPQAIISKEQARVMELDEDEAEKELINHRVNQTENGSTPLSNQHRSLSTREVGLQRMRSRVSENGDTSHDSEGGLAPKRGMILPFKALAMSFDSVQYFVDMPPEMKEQGVTEDKLQLLRDVTGAFRPGVLTALMGVSGAGKTTLMDVLAGRKTGGYIEGEIKIAGFPKKQETFARISGYCEQTDIYSPQVTVHESLIYSAFLRLPQDVSTEEKMTFVEEVMELVELDNLKNAIVGVPGVSGLSTEQRKRLTIAVELVANPSIIFMDEPTSGLDARAAANVMRTVRNTVDTGRTVVCTIHQPSIDIFEAFDELFLMKRGGQVIYAGPLGHHSKKIIEYFEAIPGVPKIKDKYNPATWMLEVSSVAMEVRLGLDFALYYTSSPVYRQNKTIVEELSTPLPDTKDLYFSSKYSQSTWNQYKLCLWKQWITYWRSLDYNLIRFIFTTVLALIAGSLFWKIGSTRKSSNDLLTIIGAMYTSAFFIGASNSSNVQPVVSIERTVFYHERAAGMYSALPYAMGQVIAEVPYATIQLYTVLSYTQCWDLNGKQQNLCGST